MQAVYPAQPLQEDVSLLQGASCAGAAVMIIAKAYDRKCHPFHLERALRAEFKRELTDEID